MSGQSDEVDFGEQVGRVLVTALKMKTVMLRRGLTRARAVCPAHEASGVTHYLHGAIVGPRQHFHMACDEPKCHMRIME